VIHPATTLRPINDSIGLGVVATRLIPKGTIVWVRDDLDRTITFQEFKALPPQQKAILDHYVYLDEDGFVLCWDHARFLNHSCDPNCLSGGYDFEIAVRDIHAGEELTCDYGAMNPDCVFHCACGLPKCRKEILPNDLVSFSQAWDAIVAGAVPLLEKVEQPLWDFLDEDEEKQLRRALAGKEPFVSCRENYLGPIPELATLWDEGERTGAAL
jgi:hypothetical protein